MKITLSKKKYAKNPKSIFAPTHTKKTKAKSNPNPCIEPIKGIPSIVFEKRPTGILHLNSNRGTQVKRIKKIILSSIQKKYKSMNKKVLIQQDN